jgi:prepilin-type N-terminal cleavage/methylation domain-containing protein
MKHISAGIRSQKGFTIIEIVAVLVISLVVILPLMKVVASSLEQSNEDQYLSHCAFLAQLKIEEVRSRANCYTNAAGAGAVCPVNIVAPGGSDFKENFSQTAAQCSFPAPFDKYECTVKYVSSTRSAGISDRLKTIQVRVWYDKDSDGSFDSGEGEPDVFLETQLAIRPPDW